ncbi:MAG: NADH-ubiquinone oxidoreductase-F iron-sulfur binding region domain-containing protein [Candidatus Acidiferrales bacterium]
MENSQASRNGKPYLLPDRPLQSLDDYIAIGGLQALEKACSMSREAVIAEVKKSGLRGRGGAGFPVGIKWSSIASDPCPVKFVACNATEGEPGTYKDRMMMGRNPYQLLEGVAIAAYAMNAQKAFIAMKGTFENAIASTARAHQEMSARNVLGPIPIEFVYGPEDYLLGEEKAMLEVIEGREAMPREMDYPPYVLGLFAGYPSCIPDHTNPTLVNNCESMSNIPHIIRNGADWFRSMGTADTPGHMVFTLSGDVQHEGVFELPLGTTLRELAEKYGGGLRPGRKLKAIFSGVASAGVYPDANPNSYDTPLDFGSMRNAGSGLGSGGFMVYDDTNCMVQVAYCFSKFLWIESCGQCRSCKDGTYEATRGLENLINGTGDEIDIEDILQASINAPRGNRCFLPTEHSLIIPSIMRTFRQEFVEHYNRGCRNCRVPVLPKMHDYDEATHEFHYTHGRLTP